MKCPCWPSDVKLKLRWKVREGAVVDKVSKELGAINAIEISKSH